MVELYSIILGGILALSGTITGALIQHFLSREIYLKEKYLSSKQEFLKSFLSYRRIVNRLQILAEGYEKKSLESMLEYMKKDAEFNDSFHSLVINYEVLQLYHKDKKLDELFNRLIGNVYYNLEDSWQKLGADFHKNKSKLIESLREYNKVLSDLHIYLFNKRGRF